MRHASELLATLGVPRDRVVYVQSSVDWMARAGLDAVDTLRALRDHVGARGTLVMPSYPFHSTHVEYLASSPRFDVRRTPSTIGLLPEMFRRTAGVVRSLDPDFSVAGLGPEAPAIVGIAPSGPDPFGRDSSYQRMLDREAVLVGLGVSLNTSSFIHVVDSRAQARYPSPVYVDTLFEATVVDSDGHEETMQRLALKAEFQQRTEPSAIVETMRPAPDFFTVIEVNGACFFRWDLEPWVEWCLEHAETRAARGEWPCWLRRLVNTHD